MNLWRMHLEKSTGQEKLNGALLSVDEEEIKRSNPSTMGKGATKTRASLFGLGAPNPSNQSSAMQRAQAQAFRAYGLAAPKPKAAKRVSEDRSDAMGCSTKGGADSDSEYDMGFGMGEVGPFKIPDIPKLAQAEASWSESGLTVSYDIPGLRTIVPSFTKRRHRIASVPLSDVAFSHIMVPKLRAAVSNPLIVPTTPTQLQQLHPFTRSRWSSDPFLHPHSSFQAVLLRTPPSACWL